ncbi:MAG: response regulator [Thermogutta sp.]|nr:response regulator [Thermogutta sp.]
MKRDVRAQSRKSSLTCWDVTLSAVATVAGGLLIAVPAALNPAPGPLGHAAALLTAFAILFFSARCNYRRLAVLQKEWQVLSNFLIHNSVATVRFHELLRDESGRPIDDVILEANPAFERHTGCGANTPAGRPMSEVFPGFHESSLFARMCHAVENRTPVHYEDYFPPLQRYYDIDIHPLGGDRLATIFVDITHRKRLEEDLRRQSNAQQSEKESLQAILDAAPTAMVVLAEDGAVEHLNRVAAQLVGENAAGWVGRQPGDGLCCIHAATAPAGCGSGEACKDCPIRNAINTVLRTGRAVLAREVQRELALGGAPRPYWFSLSAVPVALGRGRRVLLSLINVTERKAAEEELRRTAEALAAAKEAAEQANRAKSAFLANMSHEIRSPMNAVLGFAEVLAGSLSDPAQLDAVDSIRRNGQHLLQLINDILDLSKVEAGKMTIAKEPVKTAELIGDVAALMRAPASGKSLKVSVSAREVFPETIQTDPIRLRQILINLLANAIKFTEVGEVTLTVGMRAETDGPPRVAFEVRDTGIGMTPEQTSRLFRPFSQGDESTSRRFGGTGLGLAISKRLAKLLGGDISVQSEPGKGSCFTVTIDPGPLEGVPLLRSLAEGASESQAAGRPEKEPLPSLPPGCRILLAEDGPDNQRLFAFLLRRAGAEVTIAENGRIACEYVLGQDAGTDRPDDVGGKAFDLILMDMQMPEMDGWEAVRRLRQAGVTVPIVALTAQAMPEDRVRCTAAGCDDYLSKPCDARTLLSKAAEWIGTFANQPADPR